MSFILGSHQTVNANGKLYERPGKILIIWQKLAADKVLIIKQTNKLIL